MNNWNLEYDEYGYNYNYVGIDGEPVKRTKEEYPYSYDSYVVWEEDYNKTTNNAVYSDRLIQWDYDKFNKCCRNIWGNERQYFNDRSPKDIGKFLSLYFDKEVKLTVIMEGCNFASGYPYWIFYYEDINK